MGVPSPKEPPAPWPRDFRPPSKSWSTLRQCLLPGDFKGRVSNVLVEPAERLSTYQTGKTCPLSMSLSGVCQGSVQGFVQGLKCRKPLILLICHGVKGLRGGEG